MCPLAVWGVRTAEGQQGSPYMRHFFFRACRTRRVPDGTYLRGQHFARPARDSRGIPMLHVYIHRHASRGVRSFLLPACALLLAGCGGGGYDGGSGGGSAPPPASLTVSLAVAPASIVAGQGATLTWSAPPGATCTAGGGWSGSQASSGTQAVTPAAAGSVNYTLSCSATGGAYGAGSSGSASATLSVTAPSGYTSTALVGDTVAAGALVVDASLVNPWGVAFGPGFSWVANNHGQNSTLYDGNGKAQPTSGALVVGLPAGTLPFDPTGVVFNGSSDFVVSANAISGVARFLFVGEGGLLAGWSPAVDATHAVTVYSDAGGAVYKGLALAASGGANYLYATDFHNGKVDVFDAAFVRQLPAAGHFQFADPTLPAGYAPFGIQALPTGAGGATQVFVSYAQQSQPDLHDNLNGAGLGLIDVYDAAGTFIKRLVDTGGRLNAPWGMARAPSDFGTLSGALLVGNFGDGTINGYDAATGAYVGTVASAGGAAFAAPGLWGIAFGNDADNQPHNTLFYAAGTNNEANGVYGRIDLGGAPVLNAPPVVAVTSPVGSVHGVVTVTATATASVGIARVEFFANGTSIGVATTSPYSVQWDTTALANGTSVALTAKATDVDGNVGSSPAASVTAGTVTLSQLQATIFTPICSACHTGVGSALPGVQNLTNGNTWASLVNTASLEVPTLKRVLPGDAANSYIIQKLEGSPGISGVRMPAGGPYLDQATIDKVKAWIAGGALDN